MLPSNISRTKNPERSRSRETRPLKKKSLHKNLSTKNSAKQKYPKINTN